ncbi:MAG: PEP-CTERM sorting domain-containing protein [Symploca sp. SIO2C1]|nr:PEP-CTERM sorting domain-containing protein [Symploca sp. SIO2C1]
MKKIETIKFLAVTLSYFAIPSGVHALPVRDIPNLTSITFWERSGGTAPTAFTFGINSPQLTTRLSEPLSTSNSDFSGVPGTEFYDVYYSDADGKFNLDGEFLTISSIFNITLPAGGGLNLAEIGLNFAGEPTEFGNFVASFIAFGDNALPASVGNAIDGDLLTHTTMGNTVGQTERLSLTLGFLSSSGPLPTSVPEPSSYIPLGIGLFLLGVSKNR